MNRNRLSALLILSILVVAGQGSGAAETLPCADRSISAGAIRTREDIKAFVICAQEYLEQVGADSAYDAFHNDPRWRSGPIYVFATELVPDGTQARSLLHPGDPARETADPAMLGDRSDEFGSDIIAEAYRIITTQGGGWWYYGFADYETGVVSPKASYIVPVDWNGIPAFLGAGIYQRDLPGTCRSDEVNASVLAADPSEERLQEFVRCAAMELESMGYFASVGLVNGPRWRSGSIYLFGLDTYGYTFFSGSAADSSIGSELSSVYIGSFGGRDVLRVADAFGETFLYYSNHNPATNQRQRKVTFVKRVASFGVPVLIGAGYYPDSSEPEGSRVVVAGDDAMLGDDDYVLNNATITGDTLTTSVSYGGGCETHVFTLVIAASFIDGSPVQLPVFLRHEANGDSCEAWLTQSYTFDLALVRTRYREAYGPGAGRVALRLDGVPADSLVYEFSE